LGSAARRRAETVSFLKTGFNEMDGQFSPDGRRVAYQSDESGRYEVYVAPFHGSGGKRQVSPTGGVDARWRRDGKELFYTAPDGRLMVAEVNIKGAEVEIGAVRPLFGTLPVGYGYQYDVSADGQRFLAVMPNEQAVPEPLTLVQNWTAALKK
jgi:dipeptidyl aminopeptidase/acylaminoacyl peptidase